MNEKHPRRERRTFDAVDEGGLAFRGGPLCGRVTHIVAMLRATNEACVGIDLVWLEQKFVNVSKCLLTAKRTMPEGYAKVLEARGTGGKVPVTCAFATATERAASAKSLERVEVDI